ncbi:putative duf967 domain-containing protein [Rosellinia necatrix]|uniref:Putative duf967 domain-containing protein n=1 Tax=Rosellinia necatrix TaxID=77044 RepID=A0A1W2TVZ5_ROSNE|nr:putative duf967 domain-containing protein [Rosellinia necatrix]
MSQKVLRRKDTSAGVGLRAVLAVQAAGASATPVPIPHPPENAETVKATCDSFTLDSFTAADAWELGHLLYARLLPFATAPAAGGGGSGSGSPAVISIATAGGQHVLFQAATGPGTTPDNDAWVRRKRAAALRFAASTWLLHCKFAGDEAAFRDKFGLSRDAAGEYAIHGGAVPIRVSGVEGIVAVVVVSGLKQQEDHGVIVDVINSNWE